MGRYAGTIFLSAFLLFAVQPLAGKIILPWFGGSPSVWTTCMLFFQVLLLAGYAYAHLVVSRLSARNQGWLHLALLAVSLSALFWFPPSPDWRPTQPGDPSLRILLLLGSCIGIPYLLLASTGPLLQGWFSRTHRDRSPYRLYALSNVGSLLALLSYPFLVETQLRVVEQAASWKCLYALFVGGCGWCAIQLIRSGSQLPAPATETEVEGVKPAGKQQHKSRKSLPAGATNPAESPDPPPWGDVLMWLALAGCGSLLLLSTTNQLCQDVAVVPFLWIVPLALYLLTFIICFDNQRWYLRGKFSVALGVAASGSCLLLYSGVEAGFTVQILGYSAMLFIGCMVCHGELVRLKPHPQFLTLFYLMVSAGGALGGAFTALVAPHLFLGFWEYHLAIALVCLLMLVVAFRDQNWILYRGHPRGAWAILLASFLMLLASLGNQICRTEGGAIARGRNFFGALRVEETDESLTTRGQQDPHDTRRSLKHGRILHGFQFLDPNRSRNPTTYFGYLSGVGVAMVQHPQRQREDSSLHVGVVGLGTGTIAALGRPGDTITFFEINPLVKEFNERWFTYLQQSQAATEVKLGDARILMEQECADHTDYYDVLVVDAFSGDAIPVHLLTRECWEIYLKLLKPDGILCMHISNRFLRLEPVVYGLADHFGLQAVLLPNDESPAMGISDAQWVLVTKNPAFLKSRLVQGLSEPLDKAKLREMGYDPVIWSDDFSNLFDVLQ